MVEVYPQQLVFRVLVVEARCTPWSWFEGYRVVVEVYPLELVGRVLVIVKVYHVGLVCVGVPSIYCQPCLSLGLIGQTITLSCQKG